MRFWREDAAIAASFAEQVVSVDEVKLPAGELTVLYRSRITQ